MSEGSLFEKMRPGHVLRSQSNGQTLTVQEIDEAAELVMAKDHATGETEWLLDLDDFTLVETAAECESINQTATQTELQIQPPDDQLINGSDSLDSGNAQVVTAESPIEQQQTDQSSQAKAFDVPSMPIVKLENCATTMRVVSAPMHADRLAFSNSTRQSALATAKPVIEAGDTVCVHAKGDVVISPGHWRPFWDTREWVPGQPFQEPFKYIAGQRSGGGGGGGGGGGVIVGWDRGCLGAGVGEVRELFIPAEEGYASAGLREWTIPPNTALHFVIEVVRIVKKDGTTVSIAANDRPEPLNGNSSANEIISNGKIPTRQDTQIETNGSVISDEKTTASFAASEDPLHQQESELGSPTAKRVEARLAQLLKDSERRSRRVSFACDSPGSPNPLPSEITTFRKADPPEKIGRLAGKAKAKAARKAAANERRHQHRNGKKKDEHECSQLSDVVHDPPQPTQALGQEHQTDLSSSEHISAHLPVSQQTASTSLSTAPDVSVLSASDACSNLLESNVGGLSTAPQDVDVSEDEAIQIAQKHVAEALARVEKANESASRLELAAIKAEKAAREARQQFDDAQNELEAARKAEAKAQIVLRSLNSAVKQRQEQQHKRMASSTAVIPTVPATQENQADSLDAGSVDQALPVKSPRVDHTVENTESSQANAASTGSKKKKKHRKKRKKKKSGPTEGSSNNMGHSPAQSSSGSSLTTENPKDISTDAAQELIRQVVSASAAVSKADSAPRQDKHGNEMACNFCGGTHGMARTKEESNHSNRLPLLLCTGCKSTYYCCPAHQKEDWNMHRAACLFMRKHSKSTADGNNADSEWANDMTGTFRWAKNHDFQKLVPTFPVQLAQACIRRGYGWKQYLPVRLQQSETKVVQPAMLDGISFGLTALRGIQRCLFHQRSMAGNAWNGKAVPKILLVAVGAARKTEQRILEDTEYWAEIGRHLPKTQIHLALVGLEIEVKDASCSEADSSALKKTSGGAATSSEDKQVQRERRVGRQHSVGSQWKRSVPGAPNMTSSVHRGTVRDFLRDHSSLLGEYMRKSQGSATRATNDAKSNVLFLGLNTGCGSGNASLMTSWLPDLLALLRSNYPVYFSCANDYGDLFGETQIMKRVLGARYIAEVEENPYRACTTLHAPGRREAEWSCANSFTYGVRGFAEGGQQLNVLRQRKFESMDSQYRAHLAAQVKQVAAAVRENAKNAKIPGTEQ